MDSFVLALGLGVSALAGDRSASQCLQIFDQLGAPTHPGLVERGAVVAEQPVWHLERCDAFAHHEERTTSGLADLDVARDDEPRLVVEELVDVGDRPGGIGQRPLEAVQLPARMHQRGLEPSVTRPGPLLRLRNHHPPASEDPRQRRGRGRGDTHLLEPIPHADRPVVPTRVRQFLAHTDRELFDLDGNRQRRASHGTLTLNHRLLSPGPPRQRLDLIEARPRDTHLTAEPRHRPPRSILRPGHHDGTNVHRNHPVCHERTMRSQPLECPDEPETEVSAITTDSRVVAKDPCQRWCDNNRVSGPAAWDRGVSRRTRKPAQRVMPIIRTCRGWPSTQAAQGRSARRPPATVPRTAPLMARTDRPCAAAPRDYIRLCRRQRALRPSDHAAWCARERADLAASVLSASGTDREARRRPAPATARRAGRSRGRRQRR